MCKIDAFLFEVNAKGEYTFITKPYCDFIGKEREDVLCNGWVNAVHADDRDEVWNEWQACLHQNRDFIYKFRIIDKDNNIVPVTGKAHVVYRSNARNYRIYRNH